MESPLFEDGLIRLVLYQAAFWPIVHTTVMIDATQYSIARPRLYGIGGLSRHPRCVRPSRAP